ncbi:MAG: hypothetical protein KDA37_09190 [Planctomycetales bacterium]|nr:hypothetical protein [Planctomycetales bacterium]
MNSSYSRLVRVAAWIGLGILAAEGYAQLPLQPYASYWKPDTAPNSLLAYDYDSDPDAQFNKGSVPLATRISNPALQANPHARPNEARVMSLAAFNGTSNNPSQGSNEQRYYAFSHWQYLDALVFWGGSAGEGNILAPNGPIIDAAHRNGVPVYGNIFLPPTVFGGDINRLSDLVQKSPDGSFPVADKLIDIAQRNRFDGWFINQETEGASSTLAAQTREFLRYMEQNSSLDIVWYDSMLESGQIAWQGALNSVNNSYFEGSAAGSADRAADSMFLDFRWSPNSLVSSANYAARLGRNRYELYAGVNVEGAGWNQTGEPLDQIFPEGQPHRTSMGFYRPEWTLNQSSTVADFYDRESSFWTGANHDPSDTSGTVGSAGWKGVAHYVPEKSPISGGPFVTNFNMGQGSNYWIDGQFARAGQWNNLSLQDIVPTWRWLIDAASNPLSPAIDFTDAYNGGSSLRVTGALTSTNDLRLYMTDLPVTADTNLQVAFKTEAAGAQSNMQVLVAFADDPTNFTAVPVGASTGAGWELKSLPLGAYAGKTISQIGLRFAGQDPSYDIKIGRLGVIEGAADPVAAPENLTLLDYGVITNRVLTLRLTWEHSPDYATDDSNGVYYYQVFKVDPDGHRDFLGGTLNNSFFVRRVFRSSSDPEFTIEVVAVSEEFGVSSASSFVLDWDSLPTGLPGDYNNDGVVDAADYTVWRDNLGAEAGALANNPYPITIGQQQYQTWRDNYGAQAEPPAGLLAAPEPSAVMLLAVISLGFMAAGQRRRLG